MLKTLIGLKAKASDVLFPKHCQYCGDSFKDGLSNVLCRSCFNSIQPYEDPVCDHCGASLPIRGFEDSAQLRCRDCGPDFYHLDQTRALGDYVGPLRIAHHAFKFEGMEGLKRELVLKLVESVPPSFFQEVEALVPVPLSPERERERGYNPAALLANEISNKTGIQVLPSIRKIRSTPPQMSLTREERFKNPKGAYETVGGVPSGKIILVDDVFTTGSTLEECAHVLKKAGAIWVGALVFGRTPKMG